MIRFVLFSLLAVHLPAQLIPLALPMAPSSTPNTVNADLVLFRVDVLNPSGIWLDYLNATPWIYVMEAQWMSLWTDQQPALTSSFWSMVTPSASFWAWGGLSFLTTSQHLQPGSYLFAMADDTHPLRDPSPVVPVVTSTTFIDANVAVTVLGFAIENTTNAVLHRPPFSAFVLQPCNMVGAFPYSVLGPNLPPAGLSWVAGGHDDTCSGPAIGSPPVGFFGEATRWLFYNQGISSSHSAPIHLQLFRQSLGYNPPPLPDAVLGLALLSLENSSPTFITVDLGVACPTLFAQGQYLRKDFVVSQVMPAVSGTTLDFTLTLPPNPVLIGTSLYLQGIAIDAGLGCNISDLYALTLF